MRNPVLKYGSLLVGLMAAAIIILSQCFSMESIHPSKKVHPTADVQSEKSASDNEASFTIAATSFPASAQINFFQEASCLFEILFNNEVETRPTEDVNIALSKFYSVILHFIISPNAP